MEDGPIIKRFGSYLSKYCEGTLEQCNIVSSTKNTSDTPSNKIKIFPNPTSDYMTYLIPTNHNNIINQYCIKDISGQIVKSERPLQSEASNIINTHDFPSGLYFIQFLKDGQIVQSEKFIITN
ncbi:MAG: T9SS type A sorting domain-containing protein [Saprospiraceae bacterium]|nr:T9SS type A sorting domain-containing protein [Saprospiraceae bacterium]